MFKLSENNDLIFWPEDLKSVYDPIVAQYGFEHESYAHELEQGLVWTKLYHGSECQMELWPTMVICLGGWDICPSPEEATYFSTRLWWEIASEKGLEIGANPNEFEDGSGDEVEDLISYARNAQKEVNEILEKCRQQLIVKLAEIKEQLIKEVNNSEEEV